jgi:hypothetical protein
MLQNVILSVFQLKAILQNVILQTVIMSVLAQKGVLLIAILLHVIAINVIMPKVILSNVVEKYLSQTFSIPFQNQTRTVQFPDRAEPADQLGRQGGGRPQIGVLQNVCR